MDLKDIHIGKIIKEKLVEKSMSITEFANGISRERTTVYDIFERKSVDIELLIKISQVLDYDFIHHVYFPEIPQKAQIIIEVDRSEIDKLDLSKACLLSCSK
ncbi:MAG: helix-turn-helix domain-containing protein [Bacteroidetes bacterium]|nr:helix-turn-helix domain-containing protein [Bacteroidota bacterium]